MICDNRPFTITDDLDQALKRIREKIRPNGNFSQTIWIDAICINQADLEEKSKQVSMMHQIYQNSIRLIVWLGEATSVTIEEIRMAFQNPKLPESSRTLSLVSELPWFGRKWIIQEVFRSPRGKRYVLLGDFQCYLDTLLIALREIPHENTAPVLRAFKKTHNEDNGTLFPLQGPPERSRNGDTPRWNKEGLPSIMTNILTFQGSKCSVAHDCIFALLSLSFEDIRVGYNQSLESLNISVARQIALRRHDRQQSKLVVLFVLTQMWRESIGVKMRLPSWVPDWSDLDKLSESTVNELQRLRSSFETRFETTAWKDAQVDENDYLTLFVSVLNYDSAAECPQCCAHSHLYEWLKRMDGLSLSSSLKKDCTILTMSNVLFFLQSIDGSAVFELKSYLALEPDNHLRYHGKRQSVCIG